MKSFLEFIFEKQLLEENDLILEFANLSAKEHGFGVDVRLHIMQPADKKLQHAPRVKIYKKGENGSFTIGISDDPIVIGKYEDFVSEKELKILIRNIIKYKSALLKFWNDSEMSTDELLELFRLIDEEN